MYQKPFFLTLLFFSFFLLLSGQIYAKEEALSDSLFSISLRDGTILKGKILKKDETTITVVTPGGLEVKVPESSVVSIKLLQGYIKEGLFYRYDPNYSRLMFAPTGRPLRKGEGYFSDYYVFFPGEEKN